MREWTEWVKTKSEKTGYFNWVGKNICLQEILLEIDLSIPQQLVSAKDDLSPQRWAKSGHCSIVLFYQWVWFDFHKMFHCTYESILKISRM